ncbi:MAG: 2Fe-2S iron-sulfur cluster binding domain-containing protein, partial [Clostridia bacterium]|nr:2Fe-2S iron-sulfur cluster binding domain-containing protein [Clostridia bacterium]
MATFTVNGKQVTVEKNQKLMRYLRDELRLLSVKDGCSEGACGTCTIIIDGKAVKCCVQQTDRMEGKNIITVEGLSDFEKQVYTYAFGEAGAVQCGFCIPGMVMCAKALLDVNPNPTEEEIRYAIRNNICRCTGYVKIVKAIELAAECIRNGSVPEHHDDFALGSRAHRVDVEEKVLGYGEYYDDIYMEGMIYASAVRSKYPRARVLSIDTAAAKALPDVVGVFTAEDIPGDVKVGHLKKDWDAMIPVGSITHYLGDSICIVAAETPEILEEAKKLVNVEYEVLTPVRSPYEAMAEGAPVVHENENLLKDGNLMAYKHVSRGNAKEAIARS